jgi:hypothetical protein
MLAMAGFFVNEGRENLDTVILAGCHLILKTHDAGHRHRTCGH